MAVVLFIAGFLGRRFALSMAEREPDSAWPEVLVAIDHGALLLLALLGIILLAGVVFVVGATAYDHWRTQ